MTASRALLSAVAAALLALTLATTARADSAFSFSNGEPDGRMAMASRPADGVFGIEAADDFTLSRETLLTGVSVTGLVPSLASVQSVAIEVYRVAPADTDTGRMIQVPTRTDSPADTALATRDSGSGVSFVTSVLAGAFTAANSVAPGGIHPWPGQTTGGNGAASGMKVRFDVTLGSPIDLPAGHYFLVPRVGVSGGNFLWLSSPRPGPSGGASDLQAWTRDDALAPDWLRVGSDVVGGASPPTFNAAFTLAGTAVCPAVAVAPPSVTLAFRGLSFGLALSASGGAAPYAFSVAGALPPGMTLVGGAAIVGAPSATGTFPITVTATDADGCRGSTAFSLRVDEQAGGPPVTTAAAVLTHLKVAPAAFAAVLRRVRGVTTRHHVGARISFTLDHAARVRISVERLRPRARPVTLRGGFRVAGRAGANHAPFSGTLRGTALPPGRYRLVATPAGGTARRAGFRILAP